MKKQTFKSLALITIILLLLTRCGNNNTQQSNQNNNYYSKEMYDNVKTGMTYNDVVNIMGSNGTLDFEGTNPAIEGYTKETTSQIYTWSNTDGTKIVVSFKDKKVTEKMSL